jgi:hypothetical protein
MLREDGHPGPGQEAAATRGPLPDSALPRSYGSGISSPVACTRFSDNYDLKEELGK